MRGRRVSLPRRPTAAAHREQLILDHLKVVRAIAVNIRAKIPVHVELDDLVHDGICGLLDAAKRYQSTRNVPFAAYAKYRIRGPILDGLRRLDPALSLTRASTPALHLPFFPVTRL
jgi:RNA polymerase sigma factor for flagellar operon FliA